MGAYGKSPLRAPLDRGEPSAFFVLGLNDENTKWRYDQVVDLRGSVGPRNDDIVTPFVRPLAEKQP
jgi:hypothetical protein